MAPRSFKRSNKYGSVLSRLLPETFRESALSFFSFLRGGIVIALALLFVLLMVTYNPSDPSWNTATPENAPVLNWLGLFGSYLADVLWQFLGLTGFLFAIALGAWGWSLATKRSPELFAWRVFALFLSIVFCSTGLAAIGHYISADFSLLGGGAFGQLVSFALIDNFPWTTFPLIMICAIVTLTSFYMACALSLEEWMDIFRTIKDKVHTWITACTEAAQSTYDFIRYRILRMKGADEDDEEEEYEEEDGEEEDDDEEVEEEDDDEEEEETDDDDKEEEEEAPIRKSRRRKSTIIRRQAETLKQTSFTFKTDGSYTHPSIDLLGWPNKKETEEDLPQEMLEKNARLLETVLADFGVKGTITQISPGPVVTLYELKPSPGTRASRVISLADDIARNMSAASVRVATVPGRNVIGIELPNKKRQTVYLRELLSTEAYTKHKGSIPLILGKDIAGLPIITDLVGMPHLLIAGTTGSGKSVAINTMILSLLYRLSPEKCRFIMIDPKMLELSVYEGIPHLLAPVVTDPKKAIMALKWTVREMDERYRSMSKLGVRNIEGYNERLKEASKNGEVLNRTVQTGFDRETGKPTYEEQPLDLTPIPYIVVVVDEMADLMIVAGKDIEGAIQRLAQMARAAGIHLIMATQRPSVDVITGTIKANFPVRISFQVTSKIDSRTILGDQGAEQLLGKGDMLYMSGAGRVTRVHGPFVKDEEVEALVKFLKSQGTPEYCEEVTEETDEDSDGNGGSSGSGGSGNELYDKAVDLVLREQRASISFVQRHLKIGYNRAATLIEQMENDGVIGSANHVGKREILGRNPNE